MWFLKRNPNKLMRFHDTLKQTKLFNNTQKQTNSFSLYTLKQTKVSYNT